MGTHPQPFIDVIRRLIHNPVYGVWISHEYITNLHTELKDWIDQGALIIVDYKKDFLFPKGPKAHYAVCLGEQDKKLLILDPGRNRGGVYILDAKKIERGMDTYSKLINGNRGYIVLAPVGTRAYWRIDNQFHYSDISMYDKLSKGLERNLFTLLKNTQSMRLIPEFVKIFLQNFEKSEGTIHRLWHPFDENAKLEVMENSHITTKKKLVSDLQHKEPIRTIVGYSFGIKKLYNALFFSP